MVILFGFFFLLKRKKMHISPRRDGSADDSGVSKEGVDLDAGLRRCGQQGWRRRWEVLWWSWRRRWGSLGQWAAPPFHTHPPVTDSRLPHSYLCRCTSSQRSADILLPSQAQSQHTHTHGRARRRVFLDG